MDQAGGLLRLFDTAGNLLLPRPFLAGCLYAILAWSCETIALYLIILELLPDLHISPWVVFGVFGPAPLVGALVLLPGGIGGFEAIAILLLMQSGAGAADATIVTIVFRCMTLWLISFIGLNVLVLWMIVNRSESIEE